jgi:hypothetical protein
MPGAGDRLTRGLRRQWHLVVLACWAAVWFVILAHHGGIAWKFFVQGTDLLFTGHDGRSTKPAGLHLFATYPQLQIGPVAYPIAQVLREIGPDNGVVAAEIFMTVLGLAVFAMTQRIVMLARPELARPGSAGMPGRLRAVLLVAGAFFVITWQELAIGYGHLDDSLALTFVVAAAWACLTGRMAVCGALIGLAGASKPWALGYLPLIALPVIALPRLTARNPAAAPDPAAPDPAALDPVPTGAGTRCRWAIDELRARLPAVAWLVIVTLAAWLPFFAADSATTNAMHYKIANMPDSALRALGVAAASTPSWDRPAQVLIGCVLGAIAIARGRWPAVILLSAGARIALDPGVHGYYTPEIMAGALLWDLLSARRRPVPFWSVVSFGALNLAPLLTKDAALQGEVRLWLVIAFTLTVLLAPASWYWRQPTRSTAAGPSHDSHPSHDSRPRQQLAPDPPAACAAVPAVPAVARPVAAPLDVLDVLDVRNVLAGLAGLVTALLDGAPDPAPVAGYSTAPLRCTVPGASLMPLATALWPNMSLTRIRNGPGPAPVATAQ